MEQVQQTINKFLSNLKCQTEKSSNIPKKSLEQQASYNCFKCKDIGLIEVVKENGLYYRECECQEVMRMKKILENSGISEEFQKISFQQYKAHNQTTQKAKQLAIEYVMQFENIKSTKQNSIAYLGQVGAGKTHLSISIANALMSRGVGVRYMSYRDTITELKQNMIDEEYYQNQIKKLKFAKVLLIDDLFKGKINDTDKNIMFEILNHRNMNNLPMIISSEFTPDRLCDFDEAIGSRIIQMCGNYLMVLDGKENNYRLRGVYGERNKGYNTKLVDNIYG